jgi:hypothetical protein
MDRFFRTNQIVQMLLHVEELELKVQVSVISLQLELHSAIIAVKNLSSE